MNYLSFSFFLGTVIYRQVCMKHYRSGASILFEKILKTRSYIFYEKNDSIINKNVSRFNLGKVARNFLSMSNQDKTVIKMYNCRSYVVKLTIDCKLPILIAQILSKRLEEIASNRFCILRKKEVREERGEIYIVYVN